MKQITNAFKFTVENKNNGTVDIHIDGEIVDSSTQQILADWYGDTTSVSYKSFRNSIPDDVRVINLKVNSGGGHVGDAMAIHDYMEELEAKGVTVNREGRGIVASAATYLVMGKNSTLSKNCLFMIHEVAMNVYGTLNVTEMRNVANSLEVFNNMIVDFYAGKTGISKTVVANMMKAETWMTASDAFSKRFVENEPANTAIITNRIPAEKWPFSNTAMLNTYNSFFTNNSSEMENTLLQELKAGFAEIKNLFAGGKDKLDTTAVNTHLDAIETAVTNLAAANTDAINNAVTAALSGEAFTTAVNNAVAEKTKDMVNNQQLTDATTGLAAAAAVTEVNNKLDKLQTDIIAKLGNHSKSDPVNEDEPVVKGRNKNGMFSGKNALHA